MAQSKDDSILITRNRLLKLKNYSNNIQTTMLKCSDNVPKICRKGNAFCENVKLTYKYCQMSYRYCNRIQNFSLKIDNWYHFFYKVNNSWHTYCLVHETIFDKTSR